MLGVLSGCTASVGASSMDIAIASETLDASFWPPAAQKKPYFQSRSFEKTASLA
jgi:hypothetical protein